MGLGNKQLEVVLFEMREDFCGEFNKVDSVEVDDEYKGLILKINLIEI